MLCKTTDLGSKVLCNSWNELLLQQNEAKSYLEA
jgi:hypothetical protein